MRKNSKKKIMMRYLVYCTFGVALLNIAESDVAAQMIRSLQSQGVEQDDSEKSNNQESVEYTYDTLGRIETVKYSDGTVMKYEYDANGNITSIYDCTKKEEEISEEKTTQMQENSSTQSINEEQSTEKQSNDIERTTQLEGSTLPNEDDERLSETTTQVENNTVEVGSTEITTENVERTTENTERTTENVERTTQAIENTSHKSETTNNGEKSTQIGRDENHSQITKPSVSTQSNSSSKIEKVQKYTESDLKNYNKFKKKQPKIKNVKSVKKGKKYSVLIKIKQVNSRKKYGEIGYQIVYSTNKKFKKYKKVTVNRAKSGKYTSKKISINYKKEYFVKVRAYMNTKGGNRIYTKYSKVKTVKVKK